MIEDRARRTPADQIVTTPFRTMPMSNGRERRVSITESPNGKGVAVEIFSSAGRLLNGPIFLFPKDAPGFLSAMTAAFAAIGAEVAAERAHEAPRSPLAIRSGPTLRRK